ncbi:MAG: response regulator transcription factor [Anaerolineales bacterium]|jgi:DNA-binding NarL/FixJ family response regulator
MERSLQPVSAAKLYIIDEHPSVRSALVERLGRAANLQVIGHGGEAASVLGEIRTGHPDVVLLEVKRKDGMGLEILRQLATLPKAPRLAVLTSYPTKWEEQAARRAGADCYLLKDIDSEELIKTIENMLTG